MAQFSTILHKLLEKVSGSNTFLNNNLGIENLDLELYFFVGNPLNNNIIDKSSLVKNILIYPIEFLKLQSTSNNSNINMQDMLILSLYSKFNLICNYNLDTSIILDKHGNQSEQFKFLLRNMLINVTNHINVISRKDHFQQIQNQNTKIKPISLNKDLYFIFKIDGFSPLSSVNSSREV
jgi:hypothetical protein